MKKGTLYLLPSALGEDHPWLHIPPLAISLLNELRVFIVEDARTARRYMRSVKMMRHFDELDMRLLNEHTSAHDTAQLLEPALAGNDTGLLSDAGCPAIADPGSQVVRLAHTLGIKVVPVAGPSSVLLTLMASGLQGQQFAFHGYLPRESAVRKQKIKALDNLVWQHGATQLFMDTPYRNNQVLADVLASCRPQTMLCIASSLTTSQEKVTTKSIGEWGSNKPALDKVPAMFAIGQ